MKEQLRVYLDNLFQDAPHTARAAERKGQLFRTLSDKYDELIAEGNDPQTAMNIVVRSVSNVPAIFEGLDKEDYGVHKVNHETEVQILAPAIPAYKKKKKHLLLTWPLILCFILTGLIGIKETNGIYFHVPNRPPFFTHEGNYFEVSYSDDVSLVNTTTYPVADIKDMDIAVGYDSINFYTSESDSIEIREYSNVQDGKNELAKISLNGNKLVIDKTDNITSLFDFRMGDRTSYIEIYAPASFYEVADKNFEISTISGEILFQNDIVLNTDKLKLETSSGDIEVSNLTSNSLEASTISGSVFASGIKSEKTNAQTASGDIQLQDIKGKLEATTISGSMDIIGGNDKINLGTTSGYINLSKADGVVNVNTISGEVQITESKGGANIESASGNVYYFCNALTEDSDFSTISGSLNISIPENSNVEFDATTVSGYISTFFGNGEKEFKKKIGDGSVNLQAETVSGSINVDIQYPENMDDMNIPD